MKVTTQFDLERGIRRHKVTGELTFDKLQEVLEGVYASPEFRADQSVLWDLTEAELGKFSTEEVHLVAGFVRRHWGTAGSPRAALVAASDMDYGMTRMYEMLLDFDLGPEVMVFRSMERATAWIEAGAGSGEG